MVIGKDPFWMISDLALRVGVPRGDNTGGAYYLNNDTLVVPIMGTLVDSCPEYYESYGGYCSYETISKNIKSDAKTVVFEISSPGGMVAGLFSLCEQVKAMGAVTVAYVTDMCASAAYAIASCCDYVVAKNKDAIVGSIGVISTWGHLNENSSVSYDVFTSGQFKSLGHFGVTPTEEQKAYMQERVDALASQFFSLVASGRPVTVEAVKGYEAKTFSAGEVVGSLVDQILDEEAFLKELNNV